MLRKRKSKKNEMGKKLLKEHVSFRDELSKPAAFSSPRKISYVIFPDWEWVLYRTHISL